MSGFKEDIHLTFSQRVGKAPLPEPMQSEYLSVDFRNLVWLILCHTLRAEWGFKERYDHNCAMHQIVFYYILNVLHLPHDELGHSGNEHLKLLREITLEGRYDEVLTLVEFILRRKECPTYLQEELVDAFQKFPIAYRVQTIADCLTIMPRSSEEAGESAKRAIGVIEQSGPAGAREHLRKAAGFINEKLYPDAVRECIHAVESVARTIDPEASNALGPALASLEKAGVLNHPALKQGFEKIYGYTCNRQGIRHALLEEDIADIDIDDAVFMFSACASFTAYLINKNKRTSI